MFKKIKKNSDKIVSILATFSLLFNLSQPILIVHAEAAEESGADDEVVVEDEASEETSSEENSDEATEESSSEEEVVAEETDGDVDGSGTSAPIDGEEVVVEEESGEVLGDSTEAVEEETTEGEQEGDILEDGAKDYRPPEDEVIEEDGTGDTEEVVETDGVEPEVEVIEEEEVEETVCLADDQEIVESEEADWEIDGDVAETKDDVELGVRYEFPLNTDVSVTFTCLPGAEDLRTHLRIEQIDIDKLDLPDEYKTDAEYAYDIRTDMENGTFEYDLTLPKPEGVEAEIIYIEKTAEEAKEEGIDEGEINRVDEDDLDQEDEVVKAKGQEHFSIQMALFTTAPVPSWPTDWETPDCNQDPSDESPSQLDILGDASNSAAYYATDSNFLYLRERIEGDPNGHGGGGMFTQHNWVVVVDQDGDNYYEYLFSVNGLDEKVQIWEKTSSTTEIDWSPIFNDPADTLIWEGDVSTYAKIDTADASYWFVSWAVPLSHDTYSLDPDADLYFTTSADANNANKDYLACYEDEPVLYCGDGIVNGEEQCDDGNDNDNDYCTNNCTFNDVCIPDVNMINNGGFETPVVSTPQMWDIFTEGFVGWGVDWYGGSTSYGGATRPEDAHLELHAGVNGWTPAEGDQYAELDTDWDGPGGGLNNEPASVTIYQNLPTIPGYRYSVEYSFSPRPNTSLLNNQLEFKWNGTVADTHSGVGSGSTNWDSKGPYEFVADSSMTEVRFTDLGSSDSLGTFLDDVSVVCLGPAGGTLDGVKYNDLDGNGERGEEPGLAGWTINLLDVTGAIIDTEVTDEQGNYSFGMVEPGEYQVCEVLQPGWMNTDPGDSLCKPVSVDEGSQNYVEFGNKEEGRGSIRVCKLIKDETGNYSDGSDTPGTTFSIQWGGSEVPMNDSVFTSPININSDIISSNDGDEAECITYNGLPLGDYYYSEELISDNGWKVPVYNDFFTSFESGFDVYQDLSDPNRNKNADGHIVLNQNRPNRTLAIINEHEPLGSIQGRKYYDVNVNGDFDQFEKTAPGDPNRLDGWTINLYDDGWSPVASMETGDDTTPAGNVGKGQYRFVGLAAGTYRVCEELKDGWIQTEPSSGYVKEGSYCHEVTLTPGQDVNTIQFGNYEGADVRICKIDQDENPLSDWEVVLAGQKVDGPKSINVGDGSGTNSDNLPAGKYLIKVSGTYKYGNSSMIADAGFSYRPNNIPNGCDCWLSGFDLTSGSNGLMAWVEYNAVNWGSYDGGHTYTYVHDHYGGSINIKVYDNYYGDNDNNGNFEFEIYKIDEELYGITEDDGCVEFENVPYREYILDEYLPEDWINLEGKGELVTVDESDEEFTLVNRLDASVTIVATKIVCEDEADLPNWGPGHGGTIDANFAQNYVNQHPGCYLEEGWEFQWGDDSDTNPGDAYYGKALGWNDFDTATDANGVATVEIYNLPGNLNGGIKVREVLQPNYIPFTFTTHGNSNADNYSAEIYCHNDILNYDNDDRVRDAEYGETYYCVAWNVPQLEDIYGYKWDDINGNRQFDRCLDEVFEGGRDVLGAQENGDVEEPVCEEKIPGWTMYLYDDADNLLGTTTTDEEGNYVFEDLPPGTYKVCEDVPGGWYQTFPGLDGVAECHTMTLPSPCSRNQNSFTVAAFTSDLPPMQTCNLNFGNVLIDVGLDIEKFNDSVGDESPGGSVLYSIGLTARRGPVFNVELTDLLPEGFTYQDLSYTVLSNGIDITGSIVEPEYASPGVWYLGDMEEGEVIVVTLIGNIGNNVGAGLYKDISWAKGENVLGDPVYAQQICQGDVGDPNFVGTQVNVAVGTDPDEVEAEVEEETEIIEEVLGASTYLPATGSNTDWLYTAFAALLIGLVNILVGTMIMRKKYKELKLFAITGFLFAYAFVFSGNVFAAETMVRIEEPEAKANGPFEISFVVQDTLGRTVDAQCQVKKPGTSTFTNFGPLINMPNGGNTDICDVTNSVLTSEGDYEFKVLATPSGGSTVEDTTGVISYDGEGPERPKYIKKEKDGSCQYELTVKTHQDGDTSYIEIYADDDKNIEANSSSRIKTITVGPATKVDYDHDLFGPDCGKTFYYAVRAFDDHDNPSDLRVEEITKTKTVTTTITDEGTTEEFGAIPVSGEDSILGDQESAGEEGGEEGSILGEETGDEDLGEGMMDEGEAMGAGNTLVNILKWAVIIGIVVFFGNVVKKKIGKDRE